MFGKTERAATYPRLEIDISMTTIDSVMEGHYFVHSGTYDPGAIEGGYQFDVFGYTDGSYWRGGEEIKAPGYRVHIKIDSDPVRHTFEPGEIGGGRFHDQYAEIGLCMSPEHVRDVLYELRRDQRRELRVAGFAVSDIGFRATLFMLSAAQE